MKTVFALLFVSTLAHSKCNIAVLLNGHAPKYEMGSDLASRFDAILKVHNKKNRAYQIYSPLATANTDYLYVVTPESRNTHIRLATLVPNKDLYKNTYSNRSFFSAEQILSTLAGDFKSIILPQLTWCLKR